MRNKSTLLLMEQAVLLVVFALAAAVCLRLFVWADGTSQRSWERDNALVHAQNAAQQIKHAAGDLEQAARCYGGSLQGESWRISFDENWEPGEDGCYWLRADPLPGEVPGLGSARVTVTDKTGELLAELTVCWQEDGL